jgi:uncharacterized protein DUF1573
VGGGASYRFRLFLCIAVVVLLAALSFWFRSRNLANGNDLAGIAVAADALDFGEVWSQKSFEWTLPLVNTSDSEIEVLEIRTSCNCTSVEPEAFVLGPGERLPVHVTLNLMESDRELGVEPVRDFSVELLPLTRTVLPGQLAWELRGTVRSPLYVSGRVIDFGEHLVVGSSYEPQTVKVRCNTPIRDLRVECDSDLAKVDLQPVEASDSGGVASEESPAEYELRVSPQRSLRPGAFEYSVMLAGKTVGGDRFVPVPVKVVGTVVPDVAASPKALQVGVLSLGEQNEKVVELFSHSGTAFSVNSVSLGPDVVSVVPTSAPPSVRHSFRVTFQGDDLGQQESFVEFRVADEDSNVTDVRTPIAGYVTEAKQRHLAETARVNPGESR